jgi:predicted TIM-barrel fold metal-dependent hydrolase
MRPTVDAPLIDVHAHHGLPVPPLRSATDATNDDGFPVDSRPWTAERAIEFMDVYGIQAQLLSHTHDYTAAGCRNFNDRGAAAVAAYPTRFGLLAGLPMSDPDQALIELHRATDELCVDGFVLVSNYDGAYLGNPVFEPVLTELDRLNGTVLLHPRPTRGVSQVAGGRSPAIVEFPVDTARSVIDALYARVFQRFPHIRFILAHAGGVLATLAHRVATIGVLPWAGNPQFLSAQDVFDQLRGLYYDTALAAAPHSLLPVLQVTGRDHIVFGTDYPPAGLDAININAAALSNGGILDRGDLARCTATTLRLFPRLRSRL